jgi:hypothetical protein
MDRPRLIRGLRIAWSVWCGILCVLLIVLWVRSYWQWDQLSVPIGNISWFAIDSVGGQMSYFEFDSPNGSTDGHRNVFTRSLDEELARNRLTDPDYEFPPNKGLIWDDGHGNVWVPHWFPVLLTAALASIPWIRWSWKYSLRTLLIATTLIAVGLGLAVGFRRLW